MWDVTGRPVTPPNEKFAVWTHPRETPGQLEFAIIERNTIDPRLQPAWSKEYWREHHPLGIEHASHITTVVKRRRCGEEVLLRHPRRQAHPSSMKPPGRKHSAFVAIGEDTIVELAQPTSSNTAEARDLEKNGEGVHALIFKTRNVARASDFLKSKHAEARAGRRRIDLLGTRSMLRDGHRIHRAPPPRRPARQLARKLTETGGGHHRWRPPNHDGMRARARRG